MPLQKWMTEHGHPGWYSWLVTIGGMVACSSLAIIVSVVLSNRALEREQQQREQARLSVCLVVERMIAVYTDPTPVTETGRKAGAAWRDLGRSFGCER